MNASPDNLRARNLRMLAVLAALFLLPLLLAFYMYYATDWRPVKRVNHGTLITPARPLPAVHLPRVSLSEADSEPTGPEAAGQMRSRWSIVYIGAGNCDEPCR